MKAYAIQYFQISGLGSRSDLLFDISARVPEGVSKEQFRVMLQNLLADRFKLAAHRETKVMQTYELVVAKNGPRLEGSSKGPGPIHIEAVQQSMKEFAARLSNQLDAQVTDSTGLTGLYDFVLSWGASDNSDEPALFSAIQSQLGLKLVPRKGPVSVIVVDHMDKFPTGN